MPKTRVRCNTCHVWLSVTYQGNPTDVELQAQISDESGWFLGRWRGEYRQFCPNCIPNDIKNPIYSEEVPF